jgi:hypothetical protein
VSPVKQRLHPLHDGAHPCADRRRIHGAADRLPVELPDIDDRGGLGGSTTGEIASGRSSASM